MFTCAQMGVLVFVKHSARLPGTVCLSDCRTDISHTQLSPEGLAQLAEAVGRNHDLNVTELALVGMPVWCVCRCVAFAYMGAVELTSHRNVLSFAACWCCCCGRHGVTLSQARDTALLCLRLYGIRPLCWLSLWMSWSSASHLQHVQHTHAHALARTNRTFA